MKHLGFYADINNGKMKLHEPEKFNNYLATLKGLVRIEVKKGRRTRTLLQNDGYWLLVTILAEHMGLKPTEAHEVLKREFLEKVKYVKGLGGKVYEVRVSGSTTELSTKEFAEYVEHIYRYAAFLGCVMPSLDPNLRSFKTRAGE